MTNAERTTVLFAKTKRRTAPEIIAFHFGWDMTEVSESRYQPSVYSNPSVYTICNDQVCAPTASQRLPKDFDWKPIGEHYGRTVYIAETTK